MDHFNEELQLNIPEHVGIILDGNGRWAKQKHMPRNFGHVQGSKVLEQICDDADAIGIKVLTVYVFSTENWKRSKEEVSGLMTILRNYLKTCIQRANKNNMKVRIIGRPDGLDEDILRNIHELEEASRNNTGLVFQVALNYGGRDELTRAVRLLADRAAKGELVPEEITEQHISQSLDTAGIPDPDLLIRTSGEVRISNFMLWQLAYTEFYFPDVLWPDFTKEDLEAAIEYYAGRQRRFGGRP